MNEQELYRTLGLAQAGTQNVSENISTYQKIRGFALAGDPGMVDAHLMAEGQSWYDQIKAELKPEICKAYNTISGKLPSDPADIVVIIWNAIKDSIGFWVALAVKAALFLIIKLSGFGSYCDI
jgi:hypothetical protein